MIFKKATEIVSMFKGKRSASERGKLKSFVKKHPNLHLVISAAVMNLIIETLGRHSLIAAIKFIIDFPLQFLLGVLIVGVTFALSFIVPRRRFAYTFAALIWFGLAVANCIVLCFRVTPLCAIDFILLKSTFSIIGYYLTVWQIVLVAAAILIAVAGVVYIWIKSDPVKRGARKVIKAVTAFVVAAGITVGFAAVNSVFAESTGFLPDDYRTNGFTYSFCATFFDRGVDMPADYSEEKVKSVCEKILSAVPDRENAVASDMPNIIFVQLESFMDISRVKGLELSEVPTPMFTRLKSNCPHGELIVPVTGCGTANTEFEILTGMNVRDFGSGEFPYDTVLQTVPCESIASNLSRIGYKTHAMHNNNATFYGRDVVFSALGFDTFTSVEFMEGVTYNSIGWAHDSVLTREIEKSLDSTAEKDFIYAIAVQTHGKYPSDYTGGSIKAFCAGTDSGFGKRLAEIEYWINEAREVDSFIGELTRVLSERQERTVLVLFGDHIPDIGLSVGDMDNGSIYKTDYVIWDSSTCVPAVDMETLSPDLWEYDDVPKQSYQLYPYVLDSVGFDMSGFGVVSVLDAYLYNTENYRDMLKLLEYDILYGKCYSSENGYSFSDISYGTCDIVIDSVSLDRDMLTVRGSGFTPFTEIVVGENTVPTEYISESMLRAVTDAGNGTLVSVSVSDGGKLLRRGNDKFINCP